MTGPGQRKRPAGNGASSNVLADTSIIREFHGQRSSATGLAEYVDHFRARVVQDALTEALRSTWLRRADAFEAAMHRPGKDFPGRCSVDQIAANNERLAQKAQACRRHASICIFDDTAAIYEHLKDAS